MDAGNEHIAKEFVLAVDAGELEQRFGGDHFHEIAWSHRTGRRQVSPDVGQQVKEGRVSRLWRGGGLRGSRRGLLGASCGRSCEEIL